MKKRNKSKVKYKINNWKEYNQSLKNRGSLMLLKLPLRQTEGFVRSIFELTGLRLKVPEFSRLSKRAKSLLKRINLPLLGEEGYLMIDSTDIKVYGESEWLVFKH
ncbi:hypothetical protein NF27_JK00010 [Candidatus Jidaibacter acanthamoeba]|uniref:Transposase DDE domain-containing protein n=1 Tax=Candidatus Jidaibacter acanthamoebae TaxID=86105 RepID=A0A0C1MW54_9RICK